MLKLHTLNDEICPHRNNAAHGIEVPPGARMLFCNGQVGSRLDGSVPEDTGEQVEVIFQRIGKILAAANMSFEDVVRFTIYVTDKAILDHYIRVRDRLMGDHNPGAIFLVVGPFPRPGIHVEIETIAAKVD